MAEEINARPHERWHRTRLETSYSIDERDAGPPSSVPAIAFSHNQPRPQPDKRIVAETGHLHRQRNVGRDRMLAPLAVGDLIAIRDAGGYGSGMASNYNRRPLPAHAFP